MEAARELNMEAVTAMCWEGMNFELWEPENTFERVRADQRKQKPYLTGKQKRLLEAERFTHTLP